LHLTSDNKLSLRERSASHPLLTGSFGKTNRTHLLFLPPYSPELQPAEHLWPLTNTVLYNRHFASIDDLEEAQAARCVALQGRRDLIRSTTLFHWWPKRIRKRQGPRLN
jgi:transposase